MRLYNIYHTCLVGSRQEAIGSSEVSSNHLATECIVNTFVCCLTSSHQRHLNALVTDDLDNVARCVTVSDDVVNLVEVAYLSEASFPELG